MYYTTKFDSPLGELSLLADENNLLGLWMQNPKYIHDISPEDLLLKEDLPVFSLTKDWLTRYFQGKKPLPLELPLAPKGTDFQQSVWELLLDIPYGKVTTYGAIAKEIAARKGLPRMSAQAVGGAVGRNPIAIIIPCHRVIGANGSLTGYNGGLDKKIHLLTFEGIDRFSS